MTVWLGTAITTPILAATVIAMGIGSSQSFEQQYAETLCRMESVRTHALEQIASDEPLTADFGGAACDGAMPPTVEVTVEIETPTSTEEPTATPTPTP